MSCVCFMQASHFSGIRLIISPSNQFPPQLVPQLEHRDSHSLLSLHSCHGSPCAEGPPDGGCPEQHIRGLPSLECRIAAHLHYNQARPFLFCCRPRIRLDCYLSTCSMVDGWMDGWMRRWEGLGRPQPGNRTEP